MADLEQRPGELNLACVRGDTLVVPLTIAGRWESYIWSANLRPAYDEAPLTALTTSSLAYTTSGDTTALTITLTSASSRTVGAGSFVWDLQYLSGSVARTFLLGDFTVWRDVTT